MRVLESFALQPIGKHEGQTGGLIDAPVSGVPSWAYGLRLVELRRSQLEIGFAELAGRIAERDVEIPFGRPVLQLPELLCEPRRRIRGEPLLEPFAKEGNGRTRSLHDDRPVLINLTYCGAQ